MSPSESHCIHLHTAPKQPSATVDDIRHCAPCAADALNDLVQHQGPNELAQRVIFDNRTHYTATVSSLLLLYAFLRVQTPDDHGFREGRRLSNLIRALVRKHGPVELAVIGPGDVDSFAA